jgi:hypothetical protein
MCEADGRQDSPSWRGEVQVGVNPLHGPAAYTMRYASLIPPTFRLTRPRGNSVVRKLGQLFAKPRVIEDSYFGRLSLDKHTGLWQGAIDVGTGGSVDLLFDGSSEGPTEEHRRVVRAFVANRIRILERVATQLAQTSSWQLVAIDVQEVSEPVVELTYESPDLDWKSVTLRGALTSPAIEVREDA